MHTLILYSISSTASLCNTCITSHFNYATWFTYLSHMYILYSILSTESCLVSVLVSQSQTMVVRTGDTITLQCSNVTTVVGHTAWFKQVNGSEPVCISSMSHFEMFSNSTNKTTFFLKITEFEITDCGLCFCGLYPHSHVSSKIVEITDVGYVMVFANLQNHDPDALNYAALNFTSKKRMMERRREKELDPHVVYAATR
uniref:Immunoglobulin subtype domain-containing protein n=1 Tax=Oncorhynchus tshawytscha TaxID=74940 RepID=A0AAZ3P5C1_ONCTS